MIKSVLVTMKMYKLVTIKMYETQVILLLI